MTHPRLVSSLALLSSSALCGLCAADPSSAAPASAAPDAVAATAAPAATPAGARRSSLLPPAAPASAPGLTSAERWKLSAGLSAGYDSNILLESEHTPTSTDVRGFAWGAQLRANYRVIEDPAGKLDIQAMADLDDYPDLRRASISRIGVLAIGRTSVDAGTSLGRLDPVGLLGANRFFVNGDAAATAYHANALATRVAGQDVDILGLGVQILRYDRSSAASGWLVETTYRRWYLIESGSDRRRLEGSLRLARYSATAERESYFSLLPALGAAWRFGEGAALGTVDTSLRASLDARWYAGAQEGFSAERQQTWTMRASAEAWICRNATIGPYAALTRRTSTLDSADYDRAQIGLRLDASW